MAQKNTYDVTRDHCIAPALILHLDNATGAEVSGPGEGVRSYGIVARQMTDEEGTAGPIRIAVLDAFVAKAAKEGGKERWPRWMVTNSKKAPTLGQPVEGAVCLGGAIGRLDPHLAAVVFSKAAAYASRVMAQLAARSKAA